MSLQPNPLSTINALPHLLNVLLVDANPSDKQGAEVISGICHLIDAGLPDHVPTDPMASLWEQLYDAERFRRLLRTNFWDTLSQVLSLLNTMASADERACVAMFVIEDVPTELFGEILSLCDPDNRPLDAAPEDELVKQEYLANIIGTLTNDSDLRDVCASNLIPVLVRMCRLPWPTLSCLAMIGLSNYAIDPVHRARLVTDGAVDWLVPLLYSPDSKVLFDASILMGMMAVSVDMQETGQAPS